MKIAIVGRTEILFDTALLLHEADHEIVCILTAREAPEYTRTTEDFQALADAWNIPFAQGAKISEFADFLQEADADIAVSMNYTGVVPQSCIELFPLGILNAHGGDLPRYRGNACQAWAILNGESRIGLCIHKMIGGEIDSGDIIARDYFPIDHTTKVTAAWNWMSERTPALMHNAVEKLSVNADYVLERQSQNPKDALRCYPRRPEDGRISWNKPGIEVLRLINASNKPYAGAFCEFEGKKVVIWDAELVENEEVFCAVPGQVTLIGDGFVEVACGEGKIRITCIEFCDKKDSPDRTIQSIRKRLS